MSYTVLARRYRSGAFDEVVGQAHVAQTLKKAIATGRIAHAYLFCGTRGTGKTSMARILAKALNCHKSDGPTTEPCGQCDSCQAIARGDDIDVIEIDAASNTGVDNIRELIENAQYRPARSRFKIYIIDEVHMLSKSAFNALLKTLEEPPEHVKFILATTEPEKVLPTILSRCQRYDFRNIPTREIAAHLKEICKKEKVKADDDALLLVAKAGAGSMRDALSLLDRLLSIGEKHLTAEMIEQLLGLPKSQTIFDLAGAVGNGDVKAVLNMAEAILAAGLSGDALAASLIDHLRNLLILRACGTDAGLVEVPGLPLKDLIAQAEQFDPAALSQDIAILEELRRQMRQSQAGRALLDATLVRLSMAEQFASVADLMARLDGGQRPAAAGAHAYAPAAQKKKPEPIVEQIPQPAESPSPEADEDDALPQPGRVWEAPKKSLSTLMREHEQQHSKSPAAPMPAHDDTAESTPAPAEMDAPDPSDLPRVWSSLLAVAARQGPALVSILQHGKLIGIEDGRAVIRFDHDKDTFVRMLEKNGKKEQVRDALTALLRQNTGVRFDIALPAPTEPATPDAPAAAQRNSRPQAPSAGEPPPAAPNRLTAELRQTLESDPLIKALMQELGGTIVKVE